ncbi:iron-siderophore ABC transporter substrate-binding protein [Chroogloeocystis siderophila]|uniref:Amino acid ABC transporter substrate-binding protein n=1 Tax=Chroogloeocystis siderophila 5.2 s.c.1 TaxID=247279 RepID=A0A1U7HL13_9CHRO|nr:iron-siderophore ABC transporter substrate-binding protein [Chroogloeocystis siderophila]OKH24241.1 amino acid ABC transporter substrate-binding protein [Chroogloeocystis siderophila 5.2 s.c.1]
MLHRIYRRIRFGLLTILTVSIVACTSNDRVAVNADCYTVQHIAGETCVPRQPQRVVALDSVTLEYLLSLGIRSIGAVSSAFAADLQQDLTGVADIGSTGEPNLEKILALQPDLIVGIDYYQTIYTQSSQIAPTILYEVEHSGKWNEIFLDFAQMLQKGEVAQQVINNYYTRLEQFKQQMGERLNTTEVSVVRIYPNQINLYLKDSFCGTILQDAGLPRPPAQAIAADDAQRRFGNPIQTSISPELLSQADGDVMFVWTGENTVEADQQAQQKLAQLKSDPLWQKLEVVQQNKIYQVPSYWIGSGPIAANLVVDDLFKYLINR